MEATTPSASTPAPTVAEESEIHTPISSGTASSEDSSSDSEEEQVEWLATGRAKRSTAGNRLNILIRQEAEDDELELLFAEDENDEGFSDAGDEGSDVQMDSSSDEEDNGPVAGADDLTGEKELLAEARASKKRKPNDHIPKAYRKKAKIDPTAPIKATPPRPKKKSERASWIPTPEEAPVRASNRATTQENKDRLYEQMLEREKRRLKQLENMEKAAKKKEANKPKELTQEDRLAEAARVEKRNAKSLNRWEEAEKIREEEQRAKLAALHNRTLEGPVITWWSGMAVWVGDKLKQIGKNVMVEDKDKPRKRKAAEMEADSAATGKINSANVLPTPDVVMTGMEPKATTPAQTLPKPAVSPIDPALLTPATPIELDGSTPLTGLSVIPPQPPVASVAAPPEGAPIAPSPSPITTLTPGIPSYLPSNPLPLGTAALSSPTETPPLGVSTPTTLISQPFQLQPTPLQTSQVPPTTTPISAVQTTQPVSKPPSASSSTTCTSIQPAPSTVPLPSSMQAILVNAAPPTPATTSGTTQLQEAAASLSEPAPLPRPFIQELPEEPTVPLPTTISTRNCLILQNFNENAIKAKDVQCQVIFGRKFPKLAKPSPQPLCSITHYPAKFRDPVTGLPYSNAYAYKEIQKLRKGEYKWSGLLGSYVGQTVYAARGVPRGFVDGKGREKKVPKDDAAKAADKENIKVGEAMKPVGKSMPGAVIGKVNAPAPMQTPQKPAPNTSNAATPMGYLHTPAAAAPISTGPVLSMPKAPCAVVAQPGIPHDPSSSISATVGK